MAKTIYPRSPRETMCGWMHLPRLVDKIRLQLAGRLADDYQKNYGRGFDALWLETAGVTLDSLVEVVRNSITDGEVADWVRKNVQVPDETKRSHAQRMLNSPAQGDPAAHARFRMRKEEAGAGDRADIVTFIDVIDFDEDRL